MNVLTAEEIDALRHKFHNKGSSFDSIIGPENQIAFARSVEDEVVKKLMHHYTNSSSPMKVLSEGEILGCLLSSPHSCHVPRKIEAAVVEKLESKSPSCGWIRNTFEDIIVDPKVIDILKERGFVCLKPGQVVAERRVIDSGEEGNWHYELVEVTT